MNQTLYLERFTEFREDIQKDIKKMYTLLVELKIGIEEIKESQKQILSSPIQESPIEEPKNQTEENDTLS